MARRSMSRAWDAIQTVVLDFLTFLRSLLS